MRATRLVILALLACAALASTGCQMVSRNKLAACESQNRTLLEQTRAQLAEIENLKSHSRLVEQQLRTTEEDLALLEQQLGLSRKRLASYERERDVVQDQLDGLARGPISIPAGLSERLVKLSDRYPSLHFDTLTGISKLDTDVLFDTGHADLRPEDKRMLDEFAQMMKSPEAKDLRIMVVGHTDNRLIAKRETRERYGDNWELSTARALAVADFLQSAGITHERMGVAGFGQHQPISSNDAPETRQKNRRVEIFVMGPETPVVGWTESITSLY